jgi:NADPH2:quinone reductase
MPRRYVARPVAGKPQRTPEVTDATTAGSSVQAVRAVVCREFGEPETLEVTERDPAPCGPGQVRVRVRAAGVNYVDALFVQGRYQITPPLPFVPGSELAGEITEVGADVPTVTAHGGWQVGDRVMASIGLGAFADEVLVPASVLVRVPESLTFGQAATIGQSYATAWFTLTRRTTVQPGEWVLVLGAAGGLGLATLDVARCLGARTVAAASDPERLRLCIERGAHEVVDYRAEELRFRVRELTGGGADVAVDPVGGDTTEQALRSLGNNGRLMVLGFASGEIPQLPANQVLLRNRSVLGVDWGAWAMAHPEDNRALFDEVLTAVEDRRLLPVEPTTYRLEEAGTALRDLLARRVVGKACITAD